MNTALISVSDFLSLGAERWGQVIAGGFIPTQCHCWEGGSQLKRCRGGRGCHQSPTTQAGAGGDGSSPPALPTGPGTELPAGRTSNH